MTPQPKPLDEAAGQVRIDYDDPRLQLYKPEEVAAAMKMVGNRRRRRAEAAKLRAKSRV